VFSRAVLSAVHQYTHERVAHRPRAAQRAGVVPVGPEGSAPAERAVHRPRYADGEASDAAAERAAVVCFDDQVKMIILNAVVQDAEVAVGSCGERVADRREDAAGPQAADGRPRAERNVHWVRGDMRRSRDMRHPRAAARGELAPSSGATATPRSGSGEGELQGARHLESAIN